LNGQVINGDALQVYRTANVLTNKVTTEEMQGIKHHLIGFLDSAETYNVFAFDAAATETVCSPYI
jgi:tRNA dimethylallyltransferase